MLHEFEEIERSYGAEKAADLRKACRYLMRHQFVYAGDRGTAAIFNTVMDGRFGKAVEGFFDCVGYRLYREPEEQWAGIVLYDDELASTPRMKADETIVLLVCAAHWQDEANQGNVGDRATVMTTFNDLYDKYKEMAQQGAKAIVSTARFGEVLGEMAVRNLVWIGEHDRDQQDREVVLRPMIKLVSGADVLKRIEERVGYEDFDPAAPSWAAEADTEE